MASDGFGRPRRGPLDEGLARMARWEELRQRTGRAEESGGSSTPSPTSAPGPSTHDHPAHDHPVPSPFDRALERRALARAETGSATGSPVEELADAVREIMQRYPTFSVSMTIRDADITWRLRSERRDGVPRVIVTSAEPASMTPAMLEPPPPAHGTPSRLADLLRENPGILDEGR